MSSFFNQVGHIGQSLGQSLGQTLQTTLGQGIQHVQQAAAAPEELRVGSHNVVVKEHLAEGGFGMIDLVTELHTENTFVLKRCNIDREYNFNIVRKEVLMLQKYASPYIAKLIDHDTAKRGRNEALLLLEYYPGGHLLDRLNGRGGKYLPVESVYKIFGQILLALRPMHESSPPLIHRDLKLENVLFGPDGKVRLCDFGSVVESPVMVRNQAEREAAEESIARETTPLYRSPEMCDLYMRTEITFKADIWALGCMLYCLAFL
eukprot:gene24434-29534_t